MYTTGKWCVRGKEQCIVMAIQDHSEPTRIADCRHADVTTAQAQDNAQLIAAAPDLLETAKELIACMNTELGTGIMSAMAKLHDAIAKAERGGP